MRFADITLRSLGYEQITGLSSVKTLTPPAGARVVLLQAETQNIRFRADGTNPTGTTGMRLLTGAAPALYTGKLHDIKFLEEAASAKLNVEYYVEA